MLDKDLQNKTAMIETEPDAFIKQLPDLHCISAGVKAEMAWSAWESIDMCRQACGGHAYSAYNAIVGVIGDGAVMTTGAGDNIVIIQQVMVSLRY